MTAAKVDGDGQEPIAEGFGGGQFGQLFPCPQEGVLRDIFGVLRIAQKLQGSVVNGALKEAKEFLKGFLVTFLRRQNPLTDWLTLRQAVASLPFGDGKVLRP